MTETNLSIATRGTRKQVIKITGSVPITGAAGALGSVAVTFDTAFVNAPNVISVVGNSVDLVKATLSASTITTTSMYLNIWRNALADLANGTYTVTAIVEGWHVS